MMKMKILSIEYGQKRYGNIFKDFGWDVVRAGEDAYKKIVADETITAVHFSGGHDVSPALYGEDNRYSHCSVDRDALEDLVYKAAKARGLPCIGICRGSQFLTVMNGGKLYQDVKGHTGAHAMQTHADGVFPVTSTHHQMMRPSGNYHLLGWANHGFDKKTGTGEIVNNQGEVDPEVVYYPDTSDLAVQYHPEYMDKSTQGYQYFHQLLETYYA